MHDPCPCGRTGAKGQPLAYAACCGPYLEGHLPAPDAPALMRSRYTAFVRERAGYLLATWHPSTRPASLSFDVGVKWLGLQLRAHPQTSPQTDPQTAQVEFVARQRSPAGRALRLHERSRFVREEGHWLYIDGDRLE